MKLALEGTTSVANPSLQSSKCTALLCPCSNHPTPPQDCHQGISFSCTSRQPGAEAEVFLILAVLAGMK